MAEPDDKVAGGRMDHYFYSVRTLLKKDIDHVLPGHGGVAPNIGKWVVEETYDGLIKKEVGLETPFLDGAAQLAQKGLLEESLFYVNKELADNPENPEALEFKAFLLNDLGRNQEALEWFDKVLAQKKDHVHALLGKGSALLALGRHEESLEYFDHVLKIDPRMKEAQVYKGMALYLAGRFDEALDLEAFRAEFTDRFKEELAKKGKPEV
jgi:tetratricopeptide (TPR) repeat protein